MLAMGFAFYAQDLAAGYVAFLGLMTGSVLHAIEVKVNRLLDHYGITVSKNEIDHS